MTDYRDMGTPDYPEEIAAERLIKSRLADCDHCGRCDDDYMCPWCDILHDECKGLGNKGCPETDAEDAADEASEVRRAS